MTHTKKAYNAFAEEYNQSRLQKDDTRLYNEYYELPSIKKALGNILGKKLLDIGCGTGTHITHYTKMGAKCFGIDVSESMIKIAKKTHPDIPFTVGTMTQLPYPDNTFDIITASLSIHYEKNITKVLQEISRVLKKGGRLYYSTDSVIEHTMQVKKDTTTKIKAVGYIKTNTTEIFGNTQPIKKKNWEMMPGMNVTTYSFSLHTHMSAMRNAKLTFIDYQECKPTTYIKKRNPVLYETLTKVPLFAIYVAQKN